jgi:hypothetical protein
MNAAVARIKYVEFLQPPTVNLQLELHIVNAHTTGNTTVCTTGYANQLYNVNAI